MNQLEQIKQDLIQNWQHHLHTEESGYDEDRESFEEYLNHIITKAYQAGQESIDKKVISQLAYESGYKAGQEAERELQNEQKRMEAQKLVQVPATVKQNGEWCICGAWRSYGVNDNHHCTGYRITC